MIVKTSFISTDLPKVFASFGLASSTGTWRRKSLVHTVRTCTQLLIAEDGNACAVKNLWWGNSDKWYATACVCTSLPSRYIHLSGMMQLRGLWLTCSAVYSPKPPVLLESLISSFFSAYWVLTPIDSSSGADNGHCGSVAVHHDRVLVSLKKVGGAINHSLISAHFSVSTYFHTVQTYKRMRLTTRVYGTCISLVCCSIAIRGAILRSQITARDWQSWWSNAASQRDRAALSMIKQ